VKDVNEIILKTLCISQPQVLHLYRSAQPDDLENSMCFQVLGFDVMFDSNLKAFLIEVNQMPSFATESPLDHKIKKGVIKDSISLLNLSVKRRNRIKNNKKAEL
jgi:tubulin polyglutamylase TTLL6/13